ncbi:class I SAM-dependent methyltransferase [Variovorax guangxiensis]|uniref:Class I SAM-dependent methyltransferase n=1 Tax=Variovorax guangxiensis TaxID=1775474 RepID=A0A502DWA9_9BURK|nr:class I SAM-dependent methyltransferase [Variovorax guangxiensis]TPG24276.1 class I SAM-dependent methyltransferase [Variovorax ginsengisoli]TPG28526.1 class I SAM-dependent methyltransferase [Variovorax guangxiensis]
MSGFSTDWLALREPFDRAACAMASAALDWPALAARLRADRAGDALLSVVDLGCGTGASLREIAPRLGGRQHWRLVDHDAALLAAIPDALSRWAALCGLRMHADGERLNIEGAGLRIRIERVRADLSTGLDGALLEGAQLVTASALLDLVSAEWLDALVARCSGAGAAVGWTLNVDDRLEWHPADRDDAQVQAQFRADQRRDKGFGLALGGAASAHALRALQAVGYAVAQARSDWQIDGTRADTDRSMLRAMVDGVGDAAIAQAPSKATEIRAWQARRLAQHVTLRLRVGHVDVLGWPQPPSSPAR